MQVYHLFYNLYSMRKVLQFFISLLMVSTLIANIGFAIGIEEIKFLKEIFVLVLLIFATRFEKIDYKSFATAFIAWALLSYSWSDSSLSSFIYGLKYEISFVGIYLISKTFKLQDRQVKRLNKTFLWSFLITSLSYLAIYIVDIELLTKLGYRMDWSTFINLDATAFCQKIENLNLCRAQGFLSGPNVYALTSLFAIVIAKLINFKNRNLVYIVALLNILLSFSRSGVLALIALLTLYRFGANLLSRKFYKQHWVVITSLLMALVLLVFGFRPESNMEHLAALKTGIENFLASPLIGQGVNFSGPGSRFGSETFIPESWILQVLNNLGIIGLGLFIGFGVEVYKKSPKMIGYFLIALLVPLNVLHPLEDAGFAYLFALLAAINSTDFLQQSLNE